MFYSQCKSSAYVHPSLRWNIMANDESGSVKKVAFCSALCAGFAYIGYNVVSKLFTNKEPLGDSEESEEGFLVPKVLSKAIQTEAPLIAGDYFNTEKTVRERVRDLNVIAQQFRKSSIPLPVSPESRPRSPKNIPWSSPLGCAKYLSYSAENVSFTSPLSSPEHKKGLKPSISHSGKSSECLSALKDTVKFSGFNQIPFMQDVEITMNTLKSLQKCPRKMTLFESRNIFSLLHSEDEATLVLTLSTISNCAAFTSNQELMCNSGCPAKLFELLQHHSEPVKVAAAQAVSNIAVVEKGYRYFQPHIPLLFSYSMHGGELLRSISLTALANLALDDASHRLMVPNVNNVLALVETSNSVVQLQALRLLVNLSCNKDMIPFLLLTKVSPHVFDLVRSPLNREITLRLLTFLANVITYAIQDLQLSSKNSTLMSFLYRIKDRSEFESILKLSEDNNDEDISFQARRLCEALDHRQKKN